ncbi:MAG TPA: ankyrin repeat domain-containing protein [Patescibacteria group bacterium]|nr:ankyrin repeat domain-containing protein [Patescibacteria group bacterium]
MKDKNTLEKFLIKASGILFPHLDEHLIDVDAKACDGDTPLHLAAHWGDRKAIKLLLEAGAELDALGDMGCTPLYRAVMKNNIQVAEFLFSAGANPDLVSELGFSPRTLAEMHGYNEIVKAFKQWRPANNKKK